MQDYLLMFCSQACGMRSFEEITYVNNWRSIGSC